MRFVRTNGLILVLCKYDCAPSYHYWSYFRTRNDVFKFDCDQLSAFSHEKETLFYGGNTVLKIYSIRQHVGKWKNYRKYMEPMYIINRMIHGLGINAEDEAEHNDDNEINKIMVLELFTRALCICTSQTSQMEIPLYISTLWDQFTCNATITLNVTQMMNDYKWLRSLFMKTSDVNDSRILLNVANVCAIFSKADEIIFIMPEEHILSYDQCTSLVQEDLVSISSQFDLSGRIIILFKWPLEMPRLNRDRINQYSFTTWSKEFAPGSISLQYNDYNLIPAVGLLKRGRCTSFDNINQNTHAQHNMSRPISAKGFAIRSEHKTPRLLATVEAFLLHIANHGFVSQVIFDMVLCFYALSINIRFLMQEEQFLCCYVTESWHSISFRSTVCVAFGIWPGANLRFTHTGIPIDEWKPHTWQETDIFDVEQVMLVEQETVNCHEKTKTDVFRLNQIVSNFNETSGSNAMEYINMETCTDDRLIQHCRHVMQTECYSFKMSYSRLLNYDLFVLSKTIDLMNGVSVIMNIVNLFTEIRMA
eukprot:225542_1